MNNIYMILVLLGVALVIFGGIYISKKYKLKKADLKNSEIVLEILTYIIDKYDFANKEKVRLVVQYALEALRIIEQEHVLLMDIKQKKNFVLEKTIQICKDNKIPVDSDLLKILNMVIDYILMNFDI